MNQGGSFFRLVYSVIVAALIAFAASLLYKRYFGNQDGAAFGGRSKAAEGAALLQSERNTISVFREASPAVVFVHNLQQRRPYFSLSVTEIPAGIGSGFLWDDQGHIITNAHVVGGADRLAVTLVDGNTYQAEFIGAEPRKDLAVLKIDLLKTNVVPFSRKVASSSELQVGQKAIAIGNPYGLDHTLTVGVLSALNRTNPSVIPGVTIRDMIQTDAAINPGNSGGPLLDSAGKLIGMNTLIRKDANGIGFAIPSDTISRLANQIIKYGQAQQLGIGIRILPDSYRRYVNVDGVVIAEVYPNSPAERAGLKGSEIDAYGRVQFGDVIVEINGEVIRNYDDMYNAFDDLRPGDEIEVAFVRDMKINRIEVPVEPVSE